MLRTFTFYLTTYALEENIFLPAKKSKNLFKNFRKSLKVCPAA